MSDIRLILTKHSQWPLTVKIIETLNQAGYCAYLAGGAVRDAHRGLDPNDLDIATDATPGQVSELFSKVLMIGESFGVCRVIEGPFVVEVATFRTDGQYKDGRRPTSVVFSTPEEDALRRDFTINALFYDTGKNQTLDFVGGLEDLRKGILRTVGVAKQRFSEDHLRILRGIRFVSQLGFPLEELTQRAMADQVETLKNVAQERLREEWQKLLLGDHRVQAMELTHKVGAWEVLFEGWNYRVENVKKLNRIFQEQEICGSLNEEMAWTLWFLNHFTGDSMVLVKNMDHWKLPKSLVKEVKFLVENQKTLEAIPSWEPVDVALFLESPWALNAVKIYPIWMDDQLPDGWQKMVDFGKAFFKNGALPNPLVRGKDLMDLGVKPGPVLAYNLKKVFRYQLQRQIIEKSILLEWFRQNNFD